MTLNKLKKHLDAILLSGVALILRSAPGIGKTTMVEDFIHEQEERDGEAWGYQVLNLANIDATDLIGYQFKGERTWDSYNGGNPVTVTDPSMPLWMLDRRTGRPLNTFKRAILFLDEYGQGSVEVKRASATLMLEKRVGPWVLHSGVGIIAATNRSKDRSGVTKDLDLQINRRVQYDIVGSLEEWKDWAYKNEVHHTLISFADRNPHIVFSEEVPEEQGPYCTPRSLCLLGKVLTSVGKAAGVPKERLPVDEFAIETANGAIGPAAAAQLIADIRLGNDMPAFDDIVKSPDMVPVPPGADAQILITHKLAAMADAKTLDPCIKYMTRLSEEFAIVFCKGALRRAPNLLAHPAMQAWVKSNTALINAVQAVK